MMTTIKELVISLQVIEREKYNILVNNYNFSKKLVINDVIKKPRAIKYFTVEDLLLSPHCLYERLQEKKKEKKEKYKYYIAVIHLSVYCQKEYKWYTLLY